MITKAMLAEAISEFEAILNRLEEHEEVVTLHTDDDEKGRHLTQLVEDKLSLISRHVTDIKIYLQMAEGHSKR